MHEYRAYARACRAYARSCVSNTYGTHDRVYRGYGRYARRAYARATSVLSQLIGKDAYPSIWQKYTFVKIK